MYKRRALVGFLAATLLSGTVAAQGHFYRGDANFDAKIDISDAVFVLTWLFSGGGAPKCLDGADVNDSGQIDISDAVYSLNWLFQGGPGPAAPYPRFEGDPTPGDALGCLTVEEITGDVDSNRTLTNDKVWRLVSGVFVRSGATLRIQAGTTVVGDSATEGLLVIDRGARLEAVGTPTHPVVFTSDKPLGQRRRGDWGGLIILGSGSSNIEGGTAVAEGLRGESWGGGANPVDDENSGVLSYVRIEFGGTEISPDNEVNALSLFGVGSGTRIDHVQVKYNSDDGIELFGGSVDIRYALATGIGDDGFDYSFGWRGRGQFWVAQQRGDDAERGFEVDNHEDAFGSTPLTNPLIANVTLVGDPSTDPSRPESDTGFLFRRGAGGRIYNSVVVGFKDAGIDIDDAATTANNPSAGTLVADHIVFHDNNEDYETGDSDETAENGFAYTTAGFAAELNTHNVFATNPPLVDPYNLDSPNFRPRNDALVSGMDLTTSDAFFVPTTYLGAVAPSGEDWTQAGWISFYQE